MKELAKLEEQKEKIKRLKEVFSSLPSSRRFYVCSTKEKCGYFWIGFKFYKNSKLPLEYIRKACESLENSLADVAIEICKDEYKRMLSEYKFKLEEYRKEIIKLQRESD